MSTVYDRIANAETMIAKYAKIRDTGAFTEVETEAVVTFELWNWTTQLIILQKLKPANVKEQHDADRTTTDPEARQARDPVRHADYHGPYRVAR